MQPANAASAGEADPIVHAHQIRGQPLHPWPVRTMHWINALTMVIMIGSGWKIYNDEVLFG